MRDLKNNLKLVPVIAPVILTDDTPAVGAIIDRSGYESLTYVIHGGVMNLSTDDDIVPLLEESDDANFATSNEVADEDLIGTEADATFLDGDDNMAKAIGYIGNKRYTRLYLTGSSGDIVSAPISAVAILGHAHDRPVS